MLPAVLQILKTAEEYVPLDYICEEITQNHGTLAINSSNVRRDVAQALAKAHEYGLIFKDKNGNHKFAVDLESQEVPAFQTRIQAVTEELAGGTGSSDAPPQDCGPGWRRRPLAQRQAIAIYRRMRAEREAAGRVQGGRARSPARGARSPGRSARSRSRSRSPGRTTGRARGGSRSRARSRSRSRPRSRR